MYIAGGYLQEGHRPLYAAGSFFGVEIMLILTRRQGESIIVGDNVRITVISVKGNQVRIGVEAPKTVSVQREEIAVKKDHNSGGLSDGNEVSEPVHQDS